MQNENKPPHRKFDEAFVRNRKLALLVRIMTEADWNLAQDEKWVIL